MWFCLFLMESSHPFFLIFLLIFSHIPIYMSIYFFIFILGWIFLIIFSCFSHIQPFWPDTARVSPHSTLLSVGPQRLIHRRTAIPKPAEKFLFTFYFPLRRFGCAGTANALSTCGWVLRGRPPTSQQHLWERAAFLAGSTRCGRW